MLDDRDIDRLLSGRHVEGEEKLARLLADTRATYVQNPGPELREHLLAAMKRELPAAHRPTPTRTRRSMPIRLAARLGAATGVLILATASLAVAGVNLPDPAADAFDRAGVTLPNQDENEPADSSRSEDVQAIIDATPPSERDCAFGHRVAEAARGEALPEEARNACARGEEGRARGEANRRDAEQRSERQSRNGDSNGSEGRTFGRETSERARTQREATPDQRREFGRETSERARELGAAPDGAGQPDDTPAGPPEGTPQGRPDNVPSGPPEGLPGGRP